MSSYSAAMRLSWRCLSRAILLLPLLLVAGCSGINASGSANPLMFLVPGLGHTAPPMILPGMPENPAAPGSPIQVLAQSN